MIDKLKDFDSLTVREKKTYASIPSNWKLKPEFCLVDSSENEVFYIVSEKGAVMGFDFLKTSKSLTLYMMDVKGDETLYFEKRFGFFSNKMNVYNASEELLGSIQKNPKSIKNVFNVCDHADQLLYQIEGPAVDPENFDIVQNDAVVGKLSKRWEKVTEEGVSKQDHFGIVFPLNGEPNEKSLLLGALFLVDFLY